MSLKLITLFAVLLVVQAQIAAPNQATNVIGGATAAIIRVPINQIISNLTEILQIIEKIFANPAAVPANASNNLQYMYQSIYECLMAMTLIQRELGVAPGVNPVIGK